MGQFQQQDRFPSSRSSQNEEFTISVIIHIENRGACREITPWLVVFLNDEMRGAVRRFRPLHQIQRDQCCVAQEMPQLSIDTNAPYIHKHATAYFVCNLPEKRRPFPI